MLIQAMACGVPVVATDCPSGPAEILENGRWAACSVGDVDALAEEIVTLDDKLHRMCSGGHRVMERAVEEYLNAQGWKSESNAVKNKNNRFTNAVKLQSVLVHHLSIAILPLRMV